LIQETCEEDIKNLALDKEQKLSSIDRKEESLERSHHKEILRLLEDFEKVFEVIFIFIFYV
jgi:ABC-type oligopeptide transport system ATPase subunit